MHHQRTLLFGILCGRGDGEEHNEGEGGLRDHGEQVVIEAVHVAEGPQLRSHAQFGREIVENLGVALLLRRGLTNINNGSTPPRYQGQPFLRHLVCR